MGGSSGRKKFAVKHSVHVSDGAAVLDENKRRSNKSPQDNIYTGIFCGQLFGEQSIKIR